MVLEHFSRCVEGGYGYLACAARPPWLKRFSLGCTVPVTDKQQLPMGAELDSVRQIEKRSADEMLSCLMGREKMQDWPHHAT